MKPERYQTLLDMMVEGTASSTGKDFFNSLVKNLAKCLNVQYAIVAYWDKNNTVSPHAHTLAFWNGTEFGENFGIALKDCPCAKLLNGDPVFYPQGIPHEFPKLVIAKTLGIESYLSVPLAAPTGELIGHVALFDTKPMPDEPIRWSIMKIFSARAAAELHNLQIQTQLSGINETLELRIQEGAAQLLERNAQLQVETLEHQQTREREASFGRILDHSLDEIYIICAKTLRFLRVNRGALQNIGYSMEELRKMRPPDIMPKMTLDSLTKFLQPLHSGEAQTVQGTMVHRRKGGTLYPVEVHVHLASFGSTPAYCAVVLDITERKKEEEALANLVAGTASVDAEQFFPNLVQHLASSLAVNFAAVTEYRGQNKVATIAAWRGQSLMKNMEYPLSDTPCEQVFQEGLAVYSSQVQSQFPKDKDLQTLEAECYLGVALTDPEGQHLGHLFIVDPKPYQKTDWAISILKIFAARASAELIRQRTELEKAQRESLLTLMLNTGPGCIKRVAADGTLLSMNPAGLELVEAISEEEVRGLLVFDLVIPEHRQAFEDMHQKVIGGKNQTLQFVVQGLKETRRWMETYAAPFNNPISKQVEHLAVTHDITERKQSEKQLQESEARLQAVIDGSSSVIYIKDLESRYIMINQRYEELFNLKRGEIQGLTDYDFFPSAIAEAFQLNDRAALKSPAPLMFEETAPHPDGPHIYLSNKFAFRDAKGEPYAVCGISTDITERKKAEEALRESEERFRHLVEHAPMGICLVGPNGLIIQANPALCDMVGYQEHELIGNTYSLFTHPDDLPANLELTTQLFSGQRNSYEYKKRYICKSREIKWVSVFVSSMFTQGNSGPAAVAIVEDITEQRRYEETLTEMNLALAHAMPGISQIDGSGIFRYVNDNYANLLGYNPSELIGLSWEKTVFPADLAIAQGAFETMLNTGKGEFEARAVRRDGSIFYKHVLMVKADPMKNLGISHHCFMRDITERKETETSLQVSEQSIRELYEITSSQASTFDQKIRDLLRLGCKRLGLPIGTLTKRVGDNLELEFLLSPDKTWVERALVPICQSFCGITIGRTEPLIFEDVGKTEWKNSAAYLALGLEAYIGTQVMVGAQVYGSLCFLDRHPYPGKYTDAEVHFLQLMARWIGGELEREQTQEALHEANERMRTLSHQLLTIQETERRQLAHDLHDEIGQTLTAVKINLQTLNQQHSIQAAQGLISDSVEILDKMLTHVRELSLDLRPSMLDDLGLVAAVRWFVNRQAERAGWEAEILIDDTLPVLTTEYATASFRVIQEAITNIMRHAQATHVQVEIHVNQETLEILIKDNGVGFDSVTVMARSASGQSFGLLSMHERVRFLNGKLIMTSQRGKGTQILAWLPLKAIALTDQIS